MGKKSTEHSEARKAYEDLMEGVPSINLGALFMPAIWGPAHGIWITILYYPLWLFADNVLYAAYSHPTPLAVVLAIVLAVVLAAMTIFFARTAQGYALQRDLNRGKTKEQYLKRQKYWAIGCGVFAAALIVLATYYNLVIRPTLGA